MTEEMKPCPFCGGSNIDAAFVESAVGRKIACRDCGASIARYKNYAAESVIAAWNTRSPALIASAGGDRDWKAAIDACVKVANDSETYRVDDAGYIGNHRACADRVVSAMKALSARPLSSDTGDGAATITYSSAMDIIEKGWANWAEKDHNKKWVRRIDGTPIPNDLRVNIAMAFAKHFGTPTAPSISKSAAPSEDDDRDPMDESNWFEDPDMGAR